MKTSMPQLTSPQDLLNSLKESFDYEELRTLCFTMNIDFDALRGEGKDGKARELVNYCKRKNRLAELGAQIRKYLETDDA